MVELLFKNILSKGVDLSDAEKKLIGSKVEFKKYKKRQFILQQGSVASYDVFIIKGLARTYIFNEKGQENIISFNPEDWWTGDLYSSHFKLPSAFNIDCLEDTDVLQIKTVEVESICAAIPKMNQYYRILYRNSLISFYARVQSAISKTASERYLDFIKRYPNIEQRVSNQQIAAYLGITPQSLSRIRSNLSKTASL
ncbi:MAG TPA: Crp/Fnr family transcriptional regulator [Flavisolibacter sp.]|jgi:CRP-like cAMP-binding protein|nr:Crp/Fnr family transcriptional regulator [Flavisolibacter sp.]